MKTAVRYWEQTQAITLNSASILQRLFAGWLPFWACNAILPPSQIPRFLHRFNDKLIHGVEFFVLFWAAFNAFRLARSGWIKHSGILAFGWCCFMGVLTETVQYFVKGRSSDVADLRADALGAGLGLMFYGLWRFKQYTRPLGTRRAYRGSHGIL